MSNTNIKQLFDSVAHVRKDWKNDWKEDARQDWKFDFTAVPGVALTAPANTVVPTVSGTAKVGQVLTVNNGTWTGNPAPTFTYQWLSNATPIAGATMSTYTPVAGDVGNNISCNVVGTNSEGTLTVTSTPPVGPVVA